MPPPAYLEGSTLERESRDVTYYGHALPPRNITSSLLTSFCNVPRSVRIVRSGAAVGGRRQLLSNTVSRSGRWKAAAAAANKPLDSLYLAGASRRQTTRTLTSTVHTYSSGNCVGSDGRNTCVSDGTDAACTCASRTSPKRRRRRRGRTIRSRDFAGKRLTGRLDCLPCCAYTRPTKNATHAVLRTCFEYNALAIALSPSRSHPVHICV